MSIPATKQPRGIRNHNPGNIRKSPTAWQGEVPGDDDLFETFATAEHGLRAIGRLLLNYQSKHGLNTVRQIIDRWAPPSENDTDQYVDHVAKRCGVGPDEHISIAQHLRELMRAIVRHENGNPGGSGDWYTPETYDRAVAMALGKVA